MTHATTVVTPDRFDAALSYPAYLSSIAVNRDPMKTFFDARLPQHYAFWQAETVREIRELLAGAVVA